MKYVIGDVARSLGLTTAALHFFEREGVIEPRKGQSTRRFYDAEDIIRLASYKKYRSMQMQVKEIAHQFSPQGEDMQGIAQKLNGQYEEMCRLARHYEMLAEDTRWFAQAIERAGEQLDQINLVMMPASWLLTVGTDGMISHNRSEQDMVAAWLERMPSTRISVISPCEGRATFGYSVSCERAQLLGMEHFPGAVLRPASVALHTCRRMPHSFFEAPNTAFEPLWQEAEKRGFHQAGAAVGVSLCVECMESGKDILCELWLPIE